MGDLDLKRVQFGPEVHGILDPGTSYASNISWDDKGRTILWLWGRTETKPEKGWNSVMTIPRILSLDADGFLRQLPAPEFESLRGEMQQLSEIKLDGEAVPLGNIKGNCLELQAELALDSANAVGLRLR